jgi:hypothetical protein
MSSAFPVATDDDCHLNFNYSAVDQANMLTNSNGIYVYLMNFS